MNEGDGAHAPEPEVALEASGELLAEFARTRKPELREEIADRYLSLAERLAMRYSGRGESNDDLLQVASLGLLKAIDGFDETRGASFTSYATPTILGELRRHFRDHSWSMRVPRDLKEALPKIRSAIEDLASEHGEMPAPGVIAERAAMDEEDVLEALEASSSARPKSLDAPAPGTEPGELGVLADRVGECDDLYEETEYWVMLEQRLERLDERDREVLFLRYVRDLTQSEIAERIGVSQMQISRILSAAIETLREAESVELDGQGAPGEEPAPAP